MFVLLSVLILSLTRFGPSPSNPQTEIPRGQIVDKVICAADPTESYALYLPSNYTPTKKWPILYAFDPGARGKIPVERYREAAERFGWIIVGSNNSQNGSWKSSIDAWNALMADTHARFSLDDHRLYAAGFSGGARVALTFAVQCNSCTAGVIASGAGFPPSIQPGETIHFAIFSTVGTEDFNFPELTLLQDRLTKARIQHQLEVFEGKHDWPPSPVALDAVSWMELNAIKSGLRERDEKMVDELWQARLARARSLQEAKKYYDAYNAYSEISNSFRGLRKLDEIEAKVSELKSNPEVRDAMRDEQRQIQKQKDYELQLARLIAAENQVKVEQPMGSEDADADHVGSNPSEKLRQVLADLRRQSTAVDDSGARRVARRVIDGQFIGLIERGSNLLQSQKQYDEAIRLFTLASEIKPERPGIFYYLSWAYAANGDKKKSLAALQKAVDKGFSDLTALSENQAFNSLRNDPQFQKIIDALKAVHDSARPN